MKYNLRIVPGIFSGVALSLSTSEESFSIWRSKECISSIPDWYKRHDSDGFVLMSFFSSLSRLGKFYLDNEKKIKEEAKLFIIKEML